MKDKKGLYPLAAVLFGFFIMGFCDIVGFSTSYVKNQFDLSEKVAGLLPSMVFLWFLLVSVPVSMTMNRIGRKRMVMVGNVVTFIGMLLPLVQFSFLTVMVAFALLGIGNTILQVSLNPLLTNVVAGDRLTSALNGGQVIKAVSSFGGPFIALFAAQVLGDWKMMFPIFAAISVLATVLLRGAKIDESPAEGGSSVGSVFSLLADRKILLLFLGIVAVVGVDVGVNTLAPKLLMERAQLSVEQAGLGSGVYFFCRVAGAFVGTVLLTKMTDRAYCLIHVLAGLVALAALIAAPSNILILTFIGLAGFCFSSIFSVIYSAVMKYKPESTNEISGLMITGICGGAIVPPLMGLLADVFGSQTGSLTVIIVCAVYLLALVRSLHRAE